MIEQIVRVETIVIVERDVLNNKSLQSSFLRISLYRVCSRLIAATERANHAYALIPAYKQLLQGSEMQWRV